MTAIPRRIDAVLMVLVGGKGYSPALRKGLDRIAIYVMRAFGGAAPDRAALAKAAAKVKDCLALAMADGVASADRDAIENIQMLNREIQAVLDQVPMDAAPAPALQSDLASSLDRRPAAPNLPSRPPPVVSPPLARTLRLPLGPAEELNSLPALPRPVTPPPVPPAVRPVRKPPPEPPVPIAAPPTAVASNVFASTADRKVILATLSRTADLYSRRRALLRDPLARWGDFCGVEGQLERALEVMRWMGADGVFSAAGLLADADDEAEAFASLIGLVRMGGAAELGRACETAEKSPRERAWGLLGAFRFSGDPPLTGAAKALLHHADGEIRAAALAALAEQEHVTADVLIDLLHQPDGHLVRAAADLLAWLGRPASDADAIRLRLRGESSYVVRCSLLFAATALGATDAFEEARQLLDRGQPITARIVDTVATAGGPSDVARLVDLAHRQPELADDALLAAGHLGDPTSVDAIAGGDEDSPIRRAAVQMITADGRNCSGARGAGRMLFGQPWTPAGALKRLGDPNDLLCRRRWLGLECCVRTGIRPAGVLDAQAPRERQQRALDRIAAALSAGRRMTAGNGWQYYGRATT